MAVESKTPLSPDARKRRDEAWKQSDRGREIAAERHQPSRPLCSEELELLRWVLEQGGEAARSFLPQLEGIRAVRWCDCGCPSIRLLTEPNTPKAELSIDKVICDVFGTTPENEKAGILLFQKEGRLDLMEIYSLDAGLYGDTPEYGLPAIESLEFPEWEPVPGSPNVRRPIKSPESPA
jgi:hypothetical protein